MADRFPFICWMADHVSKAVTLTAKVDEESAHYFLATHSPIKNIRADKGFDRLPTETSGKTLSEETLYEYLLQAWEKSDPDRDISVLIHGEAGTGKSHLINWLKLRCDYDLTRGLAKDVVPVLIRRRSGSLKDALTQVIEQLGPQFGKYLQPVRDALGKISPDTAREKLVSELSLELGPRRADRDRVPLREAHRKLAYLDEACKQRGFRGWLCRDKGVIAENVRLLTDESGVEAREARPRFTESEVEIADSRYVGRADNIEDVLALIDDLNDDKRLRTQAADLLNEALDDAIAEMTGLSGGNLDGILRQIRADLKNQGKRLALFIEDISVMSVLDLEIVRAVEPRRDPSVCAVLAVMGITATGMGRLRDNNLQRVTHTACVGEEAIGQWATDVEGLASFTGRYLNAIRLAEDKVRQLAEERRESGGDVSLSACTHCPSKSRCFEAFDSVTVENVEIGLFPFSRNAPARLLEHMIEDPASSLSRTPRGFLIQIFNPIVRDTAAIEDSEFPRINPRNITLTEPPYWSDFLNRFCGGWDDTERQRMRQLASYWIESRGNADDAARLLDPLRRVLGLPKFTARPIAGPPGPKSPPGPELPAPPQPKPPGPEAKPIPAELERLVKNLRNWLDNPASQLADDSGIRQLLAEMIRESVPWEDCRDVPLTEWQRLLKGYDHIYVDGQRSQPAVTKLSLRLFPRNEETRALIEALARFRHLGKKSWDFENGELHKRVVSRWLRQHEKEVVDGLQPPRAVLPTNSAVAAALDLLALSAMLHRRGSLPDQPADVLEELLKRRADTPPVRVSEKKTWAALMENDPQLRTRDGQVVTLSKPWDDLAHDLQSRYAEVSEFVQSELNVPQGRNPEGINFINPLPVLQLLDRLRGDFQVTSLGEEYHRDFWKSRFAALASVSRYQDLATVLQTELHELASRYDRLQTLLKDADYDVSDLRRALNAYLDDLKGVIEAKRATKFLLPDDAFDRLLKERAIDRRSLTWANAVESVGTLIATTDPLAVLRHDPRSLLDLESCLDIVARHLQKLDKELSEQEGALKVDGDPEALRTELLDVLKALAHVGDVPQEDDTEEDSDDAT